MRTFQQQRKKTKGAETASVDARTNLFILDDFYPTRI